MYFCVPYEYVLRLHFYFFLNLIKIKDLVLPYAKTNSWLCTQYFVFCFFVFLKLDLLMHFVCIDGFDWLTFYAKFAFYMVKLTKYWKRNILHVIITTIWIIWLIYLFDWLIVFNATFSNISAISWRPVLVVEEARVPGENHRPWASNW